MLRVRRTMQNLAPQGEAEWDEARWPPAEELVAAPGAVCAANGARPPPLPVCFDLEATGLERGSRLLQLAAFHPRPPPGLAATFNRYVLPPAGARMEPGAVRATGLDLVADEDGCRLLLDVRTGEALPTVSEREALLDFVVWLRALSGPSVVAAAAAPVCGEGGGGGGGGGGGVGVVGAGAGAGDGVAAPGGPGVVLVSHGAIFLDIPILVAAVRDCGLEEPFYKVVRGFCDSQAVFLEAAAQAEERSVAAAARAQAQAQAQAYAQTQAPTQAQVQAEGDARQSSYVSLGLDALYYRVVGRPVADSHRADVDARHLHELLCAHLGTEELSLEQGALARFAYTARCMRCLARWKAEWCDAHWDELYATVACAQRWSRSPPGTPKRTGAVKTRRVLVRNLLAAGYDLATLHADWGRGGRDAVLRRVARMKLQRESYLTDSRLLSAEEVADRVADYFASAMARGYDVTHPATAAAIAAASLAAPPPPSTPPLGPKGAPPPRRRGPWRTVEL